MPIALLRVDERLIHGQVVVGWGEYLHMDRFVVVDDEISASDWEQELYCLGVPPNMTTEFVAVDSARRRLPEWQQGTPRVVVLLRDTATLARLAAGGALDGMEVNLGGLHAAEGRERVLPYLFLGAEDRQNLREVERTGATVTARDLPATRPVPLMDLLRA